jgi:hypothetical protein
MDGTYAWLVMSALGQERTLWPLGLMSAYPSKADIRLCAGHVRFVPKADINRFTRSPHLHGRAASVELRGRAPWRS